MSQFVLDVIDAYMGTAPADVPESEIGEWLEAEGWPIYHVHGDDPDLVNVFVGPTWLFRCTGSQLWEVMRRGEGVE